MFITFQTTSWYCWSIYVLGQLINCLRLPLTRTHPINWNFSPTWHWHSLVLFLYFLLAPPSGLCSVGCVCWSLFFQCSILPARGCPSACQPAVCQVITTPLHSGAELFIQSTFYLEAFSMGHWLKPRMFTESPQDLFIIEPLTKIQTQISPGSIDLCF
jgi:hypothetical protein